MSSYHTGRPRARAQSMQHQEYVVFSLVLALSGHSYCQYICFPFTAILHTMQAHVRDRGCKTVISNGISTISSLAGGHNQDIYTDSLYPLGALRSSMTGSIGSEPYTLDKSSPTPHHSPHVVAMKSRLQCYRLSLP